MKDPLSTDPVASWTEELADKLLHCARKFDQFAMTDEQRTCAEASRLIREYVQKERQARQREAATDRLMWGSDHGI